MLVVSPARVRALKGHKTGARDAVRLLDLHECGAVMRGSCITSAGLKDVRDLARYRMKTFQARTPEIQRLRKTPEPAGIKLDSVVSDITGKGPAAMIETLADGERCGEVLADRFTAHHALMCRLRLDRITMLGAAVKDLDATIGPLAVRYVREAELLKTLPGPGGVIVAGRDRPGPHRHSATAERLASWVTLCPSARRAAAAGPGTAAATSSRC